MWDLTVYDDSGYIVFQDSFDSNREAVREGENFLDITGYSAQVEGGDEGELWVNDNDGKGWKTPNTF